MGSRFSEFANALPDPRSGDERLVLRGMLIDVCLQWGDAVHRSHHERGQHGEKCGFIPSSVMAEAWSERAIDPKAGLSRWAELYSRAFARSHQAIAATELRKRLDAEFARPLRVKWLAIECRTSVRRLQQDCSAITGMRIQEYVTKRRVEAACELLRTTEDKVEAIARAVGWSSRKNLNRALARYARTTPAQVRRRA